MRLPLFVDIEARRLVSGLNDPSAATLPDLMQGDSVDIVLQGVEKLADTVVQYYRTVPIPFQTIKCAITVGADVPPTDGTIRLALVGGGAGDVTTPFAPNITKPALEALLNALPGVVSRGGVKVLTANKATNIFQVRWLTASVTDVFAFQENLLEPTSETRSTVAPLPGGQLQALKIRQRPLAFTDQFALPAAPVITTAVVRSGNGTRNCIQAINTPRASVGQVHFVFASLSTRILSVTGLTPTAVAAALNDLYADGQTRFTVTQPSSTILYVECVGPLALADQHAITAEMHDQAPLETPTAKLPLDGPSLELAFDGASKLALTFELEITDTNGEVGTPIQMPVNLRNDVIDAGMALNADPDWLNILDPQYPPYDPANAAIVVPGAYILTLGGGAEGETSDPTGRVHIITHNLATQDLLIELHETGGTRRRVPDELYLITKPNDNQVQIEFPVDSFPVAPVVGQYRLAITAVKSAVMGLPHHTHPIADIINLQDLLDALTAGTNPLDLWPNIPNAKLPRHIGWQNEDDKSYRFDPVPDALIPSNIPRLGADGRLPIGVLPLGVPYIDANGNLVVDLPGPPPVTVALLDPTGHIPVDTLPLDPSKWPGLYAAIIKALQNGAPVPKGFISITIAPVAENFPVDVIIRDKTVKATLPRALPAVVDGGAITGAFPLPSSASAGKKFNVVGEASTVAARYRAAQTFQDGDLVGCDGQQYFPIFMRDETAWPEEMERELFTVHLTPRMLARNCRFACTGQLQLGLIGACAVDTRAQYLLRIQFGHVTGPALSSITWDSSPISETIIFGSAQAIHTFGVSVTRSATGADTLTAAATMYGRETTVTSPAGNDFVVRASLTQFDIEESPESPVGQVLLSMTTANASVVDLTQS